MQNVSIRSLGSSTRNSLGQSLGDGLAVIQQTPQLHGKDQIPRLFPITRPHRLARLHDMVPCTFRCTHKRLPIRLLEQSPERPADGLALLLVGREGCQEWEFDQHARDEVRGFDQIEVDVHVERQESSFFQGLLFGRGLGVSLRALGEEFLGSLRGEDLVQGGLTFLNVSPLEGGETELDDGSVVQDLR